MNATRPMTRRDVARGIAASAAVASMPWPALAQGAAHIVVIGGGFGGASCVRALRQLDAKLQVSLIEPNQTFTACPFSNEVIAGMRELPAQQFTYGGVAASGVTLISPTPPHVGPPKRTRTPAAGNSPHYQPPAPS